MAKYLIVNADDFGMCCAANIATKELLEMGGISSATIMTPCSWAVDAFKWAAEHPQYAIGLHLTLTAEWGRYRWRPVADNVPSLVDKYGYMFPENDEFEEAADIDEVEKEIRAQIAKAALFDFKPSHLDNHMGCLYGLNGNQEVLPKTFEICGELGYPFRMFRKILPQNAPKGLPISPDDMTMANMLVKGICRLADENKVPLVDHLLFTHWDEKIRASFEAFKEFELGRLVNIVDGEITEIFIHPSIECDELKNITSNWQARVWEHRLFSDPETRKYLESKGVVYINYRDLAEMRKAQ